MKLAMFGGRSQCFFNGPSTFNSIKKCATINVQLLRPLGYCQSFAAKLKKVILPRVICLFSMVCPSAVGFPSHAYAFFAIPTRIMPINIYPINTLPARWLVSYVGKKIIEAVSPPEADSNAASTVHSIIRIVRIFATSNHGAPAIIFLRPRHTMRLSFLTKATLMLSIEASTRARVTSAQVYQSCHNFITAVATAMPNNRGRCIISTPDRAKCHKPTIAIASNIFSSAIKGDILRMHKNLLFLCQAWDVCRVARHFLLGAIGVSIAQAEGSGQ